MLPLLIVGRSAALLRWLGWPGCRFRHVGRGGRRWCVSRGIMRRLVGWLCGASGRDGFVVPQRRVARIVQRWLGWLALCRRLGLWVLGRISLLLM